MEKASKHSAIQAHPRLDHRIDGRAWIGRHEWDAELLVLILELPRVLKAGVILGVK